MIRQTLAALTLSLLFGCSDQSAPTLGTADYVTRPPAKRMYDNSAVVVFVKDPDAACRTDGSQSDYVIVGCHRGGVITLPNPCEWFDRRDAYAQVACHELGHLNGWPGDHPDEDRRSTP